MLPSAEVVVLDAGKVVEQGSPGDLLNPDADGRTVWAGLDSVFGVRWIYIDITHTCIHYNMHIICDSKL